MSPVCVIKSASLQLEQKMVETETQANLLMSLESHLLQYIKRPDPLHCFCFKPILVSQFLSGDVFVIEII